MYDNGNELKEINGSRVLFLSRRENVGICYLRGIIGWEYYWVIFGNVRECRIRRCRGGRRVGGFLREVFFNCLCFCFFSSKGRYK